ncbi:MAG: cobalt-precorrin-5B (C(1))-methyltransferase [Methanomassiliicoccus sp.]|nr:cobalt-precorrin-5B (C(1))-methyltransferase [Methanomassiliicoccus sp.]
MIDPVSGFRYPEAWVSLCTDPCDREMVRDGRGVLTSDGRMLRRGFTTGTTAAAACAAAILSLDGDVRSVNVRLACGITYPVEVSGRDGTASCFKYSGDYPDDATAGIEFRASFVRFQDGAAVDAGQGIGRWDRDTPRYLKGAPAISRTALDCILGAIGSACQVRGEIGALVHLQAIDGERIALSTLNGRIGVVGGISVLGSTGLVEPWDDHLGQDSVDRARRAERAVVTTGRVGLRHARLRYPDREVILVGANIGPVLDSREEGLTLFGLPALIIRFIDPAVLEGSGHRTIEELVSSPQGRDVVRASIESFKRRYPGHGIAIIDRDGLVLEEAT